MPNWTECWVVSIPGDEKEFHHLKEAVEKFRGCHAAKFHVPSFRSSTFDHLVKATDEIPKLETECESLFARLASSLATAMTKPVLDSSDISAGDTSLRDYVITFKWDQAKYLVSQSLATLLSLIQKQLRLVDTQRDAKVRKYVAASDNLAKSEKRRQGPLTTRNYLGDVLTPQDFITDSKFLKTELVIVAKHMSEKWLTSYERIHEEVVPRSARMIYEEDQYMLFTVVIFERSEKAFREAVRKRGFVVRDYDPKDNEMYEFNEETSSLVTEKAKQQIPLIEWLRTQCGEIFVAYVHLRAIRIHVESVLRYGPGERFQPAVLMVDGHQLKKLKYHLLSEYRNLDEDHRISLSDKKMSTQEPGSDPPEYFPFVHTKIKTDLRDLLKK